MIFFSCASGKWEKIVRKTTTVTPKCMKSAMFTWVFVEKRVFLWKFHEIRSFPKSAEIAIENQNIPLKITNLPPTTEMSSEFPLRKPVLSQAKNTISNRKMHKNTRRTHRRKMEIDLRSTNVFFLFSYSQYYVRCMYSSNWELFCWRFCVTYSFG